MKRRKYGIISLDIAAKSTGWTYCVKDKLKDYGTIKTDPKLHIAKRLSIFKGELSKVFKKYNPTHVVIENGYLGRNVMTLKVLCEFAGVAKESCVSVLNIEPFIMNNLTVKKHFNVRNKQGLYDVIVDIFMLKGFEFETHNDITDAYAQSICFYERELNNMFMKGKKVY